MKNQSTLASPASISVSNADFWKLNAFIILAAGCNLINLIYYFADGMTLSATIEGVGIAILFTFYLFNLKGYTEIPKFLSIVFVNLHSTVLCYVQGTSGGAYLYLFPFVLAMIFFMRVRKNNLPLLLAIGFTTVNLLVIVLFFPYRTYTDHATDALYYYHGMFNIIINFLLVIGFFVLVLRLLDAKERKHKREKKFTDTILNTSLDAVFVVNPATMLIRQYNDKAAELFELDGFDRKNEPYAAAAVLNEDIVHHMNEINKDQLNTGNWQGDSSFVRKSKDSFHGFVSIVSFDYSEQRFIKISILDITSLKLAEFETLQAKEKAVKAAAAKTRFMSNMSHELRTPLNAIIGTMHLLIEDNELLQHTDHFKVMKNSSEHMLQLVNEVLDFSKLDAGKLNFINEPFDLSLTLKEAADSFGPATKQKNIRLLVNIAPIPGDHKVVGDEMRLKQVFLNLLSNAVKFTETGSVTVQTDIVNTTANAVEIAFSVSDTGIGIAPEKRHLIFESFTQADAETTRKYGGSGLGLSICRELVKKMGGDLKMSSEPGKGSCFYFTLTLPFLQKKEIIVPKEKLRGLEKLTGIKILVAEDNAVNMQIAKRFLGGWGAVIDTAENGKVAWELFCSHPYDLLLVDLEMPVMDGKQLLAEVRNVNKYIPAIAFTAAVYENMYDDLQKHGFNGYLHKPFRPDEMHRTILAHLK